MIRWLHRGCAPRGELQMRANTIDRLRKQRDGYEARLMNMPDWEAIADDLGQQLHDARVQLTAAEQETLQRSAQLVGTEDENNRLRAHLHDLCATINDATDDLMLLPDITTDQARDVGDKLHQAARAAKAEGQPWVCDRIVTDDAGTSHCSLAEAKSVSPSVAAQTAIEAATDTVMREVGE